MIVTYAYCIGTRRYYVILPVCVGAVQGIQGLGLRGAFVVTASNQCWDCVCILMADKQLGRQVLHA